MSVFRFTVPPSGVGLMGVRRCSRERQARPGGGLLRRRGGRVRGAGVCRATVAGARVGRACAPRRLPGRCACSCARTRAPDAARRGANSSRAPAWAATDNAAITSRRPVDSRMSRATASAPRRVPISWRRSNKSAPAQIRVTARDQVIRSPPAGAVAGNVTMAAAVAPRANALASLRFAVESPLSMPGDGRGRGRAIVGGIGPT